MSDTPVVFDPSRRSDVAVTAPAQVMSSALAARERASIEARTFLALSRPRDIERFQTRLFERCRNPLFAEGAWYKKPIGKNKTIDGLSIRFAEECARLYGNLDIRTIVVSEGETDRALEVCVTDLESNVPWAVPVTVSKTVERRFLNAGEVAISKRTNSEGKVVYLRAATSDEVTIAQNSAISKAVRNLILAHIPSEVKEAASDLIEATLTDEIVKDPEKFRKKLARSYFKLGVSEEQLSEFLGKPYDAANAAEMFLLRSIGEGIAQGEGTWAEVVEEKTGKATGPAKPSPKGATAKIDAALSVQPSPAEEVVIEVPAPIASEPVEEEEDVSESLAAELVEADKERLWDLFTRKADSQRLTMTELKDYNALREKYPETFAEFAR